MTPFEYFALLSAIWLAPQVSKGLGLTLGSVYLALSLIEVASRLFK